jgi:hypothetical protein
MPGPGEYVPDVTEGLTRVADLPKPRVERRSRNDPVRCCHRCGRRAGRVPRIHRRGQKPPARLAAGRVGLPTPPQVQMGVGSL